MEIRPLKDTVTPALLPTTLMPRLRVVVDSLIGKTFLLTAKYRTPLCC